MRTSGGVAEGNDIAGRPEAPAEGAGDELGLAEAKARMMMRLATRSLLWVVLIGLVLYYSIKGVLWVFYALTGILLIIVLAVFFAYLISPLVEFVRRPFRVFGQERALPRAGAIAIVYAALFGSLALGAWALLPRLGNQMAEFAKNTPTYLTNARAFADRFNKVYERLNFPPAVRKFANDRVENAINEVGNYAQGEGLTSALHFLAYLPWLVLIPILAFFFLKDADSFKRSALRMLPQGRLRWRGDEFFQDVNQTLAAYIRAQLIACLLIGSVCTAAFVIFGVRYALVLGVVAGVLEFIPLLGPLIVAILAGVVAGFDGAGKAAAVLFFLGVLRVTHDYFIYPRIIGSGIHLHPLAVILAILAGHELAGVAGIFLAIPVIAVITVTYRHWLEHRGSTGLVAELLKPAEEAAVPPAPAAEAGAETPAAARPP
ncbi:MAG TPA: AI-2E family transporter, partial [Pyrinomonadaceae bacterium]|nr:AI-2E family transporter [Pyrinomonadaceae bacterium]